MLYTKMMFLTIFINVVFCGVLKPKATETGIEIFDEDGHEISPIEIEQTPWNGFVSSSTTSSVSNTYRSTWLTEPFSLFDGFFVPSKCYQSWRFG